MGNLIGLSLVAKTEESLRPAALIQHQQFSVMTFSISANMHAFTLLQSSREGGGGSEWLMGRLQAATGLCDGCGL